jgi:hypothetical protein
MFRQEVNDARGNDCNIRSGTMPRWNRASVMVTAGNLAELESWLADGEVAWSEADIETS